ncbi:DNA-binding protein [Alteromonadaceae bacterium BrNp21-10]|nr:DNA-binding protein [Alteromonadaceae bacterium BrNp21-10]
MRPTSVTNEEIIEAGNVIRASGKDVTGYALRNAIGKGNPNRLKEIWDSHSVSEFEQVAFEHELSDEAEAQLRIEFDKIWNRIRNIVSNSERKSEEQAESRIAQIQMKYQEANKSLAQQLKEADQVIAANDQKLLELQTDLETANEKLTSFNDLSATLKETKARLETKDEVLTEKERLIQEQSLRIQELLASSSQSTAQSVKQKA